jgi:hypothetical protein
MITAGFVASSASAQEEQAELPEIIYERCYPLNGSDVVVVCYVVFADGSYRWERRYNI